MAADLDLNAIQALAQDGIALCKRTSVDVSYTVPDQQVLALVAELRAAREVVETTRGHDCATRWQEPCTHQVAALAAWDKAREVRDGSG